MSSTNFEESVQEMSQSESLRKLLQLKPVLNTQTNERGFDTQHTLSTELAGVLKDGEVHLIPFLVAALQNIESRVVALETEFKGL